MAEIIKLFDDKVDHSTISRLVSILRSYHDNKTKEKLHTLLANIPLGYLLTQVEISALVDQLANTTSKDLIELMTHRNNIRTLFLPPL